MQASKGKVGGKNDRDNASSDTTSQGNSDSVENSAETKISRSKGGGGLAKLIEKHTGERLRFFLLRSHYRSTTIFGDEQLAEAGTSLEAFYRLIERFERITGKAFYEANGLPLSLKREQFAAPNRKSTLTDEVVLLRDAFLSKMDDDFNTGGATGDLFEISRAINRFIDGQKMEEAIGRTDENIESLAIAVQILKELSSILGIFLKPPKQSQSNDGAEQLLDSVVKLLIQLRADARVKRDFAVSDSVRNGLGGIGIALQDGKQGTTWSIVQGQ